MRDNGTPATPGPEEDVVDLLLAQHAQIEQLFLLVIGSTGETRREAFDDLVKLLAVHETAEEEVVHPMARTLPVGGGDAMVDERLAEERQAKETLQTLIAGGVDADGFDTGIILLRDAVLAHARYEERQEFPMLRQHLPPDRLRTMAGAVRMAEATAPTRPHPSTQSAKGNLALGPALAVIDRVRDALRRPSSSG
ncbi:hemerythrin domain-containing protein [Micromonospora sp. CPCC 205561]|uniref:hemerythrin domain-containing protein n=1 Tax=Micromonospora sp. CPCC 205561 TaxID=3122407 RepID=UPI002FF36480